MDQEFNVKTVNGRVLINQKLLCDLNEQERIDFGKFLVEVKQKYTESELKRIKSQALTNVCSEALKSAK